MLNNLSVEAFPDKYRHVKFVAIDVLSASVKIYYSRVIVNLEVILI